MSGNAANTCDGRDCNVSGHLRGALTRIACESKDEGTRAYAKQILSLFDCYGRLKHKVEQ